MPNLHTLYHPSQALGQGRGELCIDISNQQRILCLTAERPACWCDALTSVDCLTEYTSTHLRVIMRLLQAALVLVSMLWLQPNLCSGE